VPCWRVTRVMLGDDSEHLLSSTTCQLSFSGTWSTDSLGVPACHLILFEERRKIGNVHIYIYIVIFKVNNT